jgi:hypothetical protein
MQPASWYLNRLRAMSGSEIVARAARQARFALERSGALRADSPPEPAGWPPREAMRSGAPSNADGAIYVAAADRILMGKFDFFGETFDLGADVRWNVDPKTGTNAPLTYGKTLNYRSTRLVGDIKYLWELNRHLETVTLAEAYAVTGEVRYLEHLRRMLTTWMEQCPYLKGANWCSSLELGLRLINWHLAYRIAGGASSPLFAGEEGRRFASLWLRSSYQHVHFIMGHLSSHSSANNHVIGELAGAYVAAATWPCWPQMERWRARARRLLLEQARLQTHEDGVNREQAVSYQQFVMYFLLIAGLAGRETGTPFSDEFWGVYRRMTEFVDALLDAGGNLPMIGDADDGIVFALVPRERFEPFRELLAVSGVLFGNGRWRARAGGHDHTARWLCDGMAPLQTPAVATAPRMRFDAGGYYILGDRLGEPDETRVVVDAGPLGYLSIAAHGHADCLAVLLSCAGREILVDPGTYCYHTQRDWRDYFRGTAAHNTVRIDGRDQSEISGPFMWAEKAEPNVAAFESTSERDRLRASHTGYRRLPDPVTHAREVVFDKRARSIEVVDEIECAGAHRVERFWHFAEHCSVELRGATVVAISGSVRLVLEIDEPQAVARLVRGETQPIGGWISRRFGHKEPTSTVVFALDVRGTTSLRTRMQLHAL